MHADEKKFQEIDFPSLLVHLEDEEGYRAHAYDDATGKKIGFAAICQGNPTIGIGYNIAAGMSREEALLLAGHRLEKLHHHLLAYTWYRGCSTKRKEVLLEMGFNLGMNGLFNFRAMLRAIQDQDWEKAAFEISNSLAARKLPSRYSRLQKKFLVG